MKIRVASKGGFCFGVKKAVETALATAEEFEGKTIYTYGPIIHNNQVTDYLHKRGIQIIEDLTQVAGEIVIVRSHGVPIGFYQEAARLRIKVIDTTCPYVRKVQHLAKEYSSKGYQVVILGDRNHPEVIGINGWSDFKSIVLKNAEDLSEIKDFPKLCFLAQTTLSLKTWRLLEQKSSELNGEVLLFNTICSATEERQTECEQLARESDLMIIVGGRHSSNTQKLYQIAQTYCPETIHIESAAELLVNLKRKYDNIGIAAGASTPEWIIQEIIEQLENEGEVIVNGQR